LAELISKRYGTGFAQATDATSPLKNMSHVMSPASLRSTPFRSGGVSWPCEVEVTSWRRRPHVAYVAPEHDGVKRFLR